MRSRTLLRALLATALAMGASACTTQVSVTPVQSSSDGDPGGRIIDITSEGTFNPPCTTIVVGQTVEFRNRAPSVPANITSLGEPIELYSPNLVAPYNIATEGPDTFSYWRHTFDRPGIYEFYDTNVGDPGRKVVDPYYGTVTFVGISDDLVTGVICVKASADGDECVNVCCKKANSSDCPSGQCCDQTNKRCVRTSPTYPAPLCVGAEPAYREFECFLDLDCEGGKTCTSTNHRCE